MFDEHVNDLLPGYALGSLDDDELIRVARHLPLCAACRAELAATWPVVDSLSLALPLQTPAPGLRAKILQRVAGGPAVHSPAAAQQPARWSLAGFLRALAARPAALALGVALAALLLVLGLSNWLLWQQVVALQDRVPGGNIQIVHLSGTQDAPQALGYLMVFPKEDNGTLVVEDAPRLDPAQQYQLWLIDAQGNRTSGGVFSVDEDGYGVLEVKSNAPLDVFRSFGVTVEPMGGSPGPTGQRVLGGSF